MLATGVILTQLLQTMMKREMNPQGAATKVITNAREAIEAFTSRPGHDDPGDEEARARSREAVRGPDPLRAGRPTTIASTLVAPVSRRLSGAA